MIYKTPIEKLEEELKYWYQYRKDVLFLYNSRDITSYEFKEMSEEITGIISKYSKAIKRLKMTKYE